MHAFLRRLGSVRGLTRRCYKDLSGEPTEFTNDEALESFSVRLRVMVQKPPARSDPSSENQFLCLRLATFPSLDDRSKQVRLESLGSWQTHMLVDYVTFMPLVADRVVSKFFVDRFWLSRQPRMQILFWHRMTVACGIGYVTGRCNWSFHRTT